jgi:mono/diheme cytochrome c family protein
MRGLVVLGLLVPLASGCGWASFLLGGSHASFHSIRGVAPANNVPRWIEVEHLPKAAVRGVVLFQSSGCIACHTYAGSGTANLGAPDLTAIGARHLGMRFEISHLKCPACVNPGSPMPTFRSLGKKRLRELAVFLEASKGIR